MAPSSTDADRNSKHQDEPSNPFVAFRRFADSQMSAIVNNVFGVFQSSPIRRQQAIDDHDAMLKKREAARQDEEYDRCIRRARMDRGFYLIADPDDVDEAKPTRDDLDNDDSERSVDGLRCPYRPPENFGLFDLMVQPSAVDVSYIFQSPYSPLVLERQELFREHSGKMRAAFADLVAMEAGEALLPQDTYETHSQSSPLCWAANLARRTDFGRSFAWESMSDRPSIDGRPMSGPFSSLPAICQAILEQQESENDKLDDDDWGKGEEYSKEDLALGGILFNLAVHLGSRAEKESDKAKEDVPPDAYEDVLTAKPEAADEQPNAESTSDDCDCFHCITRGRRKQEFLQWRREELEEENQDNGIAHDSDDDNDHDDGTTNPVSELDQYTVPHTLAEFDGIVLLNKASQKTPQSDKAAAASTEQQPTPVVPKPSILSTLTTTEQRTLPDGTVTTKVVLKKRFSDGGEEVTERVHTQNASSPQETLSVAPPSKGGKSTTSENEKPRKKEGGWFWS